MPSVNMTHQHSLDCLVRGSDGEMHCAHEASGQAGKLPLSTAAALYERRSLPDFAPPAPEPSFFETLKPDPTVTLPPDDEPLYERARPVRRTDIHRVSAIVPSDYSYVLSYSMPSMFESFPAPSTNVNCELERGYHNDGSFTQRHHRPDMRCCVVGLRIGGAKFAATGSTGQCSVCGASFIYGDVWRHEPTGEYIHIGHDCAAKYSLLADCSEWEMQLLRTRRAVRAAASLVTGRTEREAFLAANPGLEADLALGDQHPILKDLQAKFIQYRGLSQKQVAFAHRLAEEIRNPAPAKVEEATVPAPEGKVTVRGRVISYKVQETNYGSTPRMTVKIETPAGYWLAWGTVPNSILDDPRIRQLGTNMKGSEVEFIATLVRGRESHFAMFKRPTKGKVLAVRPDVEEAFQKEQAWRNPTT